MLQIFTHKSLKTPGLVHGFFGRGGGLSSGIYKGLNVGLGSNDDPAIVRENRQRAASEFGYTAEKLVTLYQIHSAEVVTVTKPWAHKDAPKADAMVTNQPNLMLGILTADCVPVLFADMKSGVIGAAHAGWKGARAGVLENTVVAMEALGAKKEQIRAVIGPAIHQESYEVDSNFRADFITRDQRTLRFFEKGKAGRFQFDLTGFVAQQLSALKIESVADIDKNTYDNPRDFYSFRRTTHLKEPDYGRQLSAIALQSRS